MIKAERHDRILTELAKLGAISVQNLSVMLDVSEATVRRDLNELHERKLVQRTHGGVTLASGPDELPYQFKVTANLQEKRRIGAMAAAMIHAHQVIGCNGGTTVAEVIKNLRTKPVRVITNAVNVAIEMVAGSEAEVFVTGGMLRGRTYELVGYGAQRSLDDVVVDLALVGVDGVSVEHGVTSFHPGQAYVTRRLTERAKEVWVVADHSKLGAVRPAVIAPLSAVHKLITDSVLSDDALRPFREAGVEVIRS